MECRSQKKSKISARKYLGRKKAIEISVPYRERVGEAEIHLGRGWKNLRFLYATIRSSSNTN